MFRFHCVEKRPESRSMDNYSNDPSFLEAALAGWICVLGSGMCIGLVSDEQLIHDCSLLDLLNEHMSCNWNLFPYVHVK